MKRLKALALPLCILTNGIVMGATYPIVDTGQTLTYDNATTINAPKVGAKFYGQDAQIMGHQPSYTDNGDGTITDNVTGLIWQKDFAVMTLDEALHLAQEFTLAGRSDWRLPSIKEVYSLIMFYGVDASNRDMTKVPEGALPFIDTNYFTFKYGANGTRVIDTQLLSSTTYVGSTDRLRLVFGVNLADGRIKGYPITARDGAKLFSVRFVCGEEYGVNNFQDNKNGTISDHATALMWQRDDSCKGMSWEEALSYAQTMNKKKYLGYNDWRLPNAKELQSIVDYTRSPESTASAAIDPLFKISKIKNEGGETDYPFFWSSTTHAAVGIRSSGGAAAAYVSFGRGLGNLKQMQGGRQQGGGQGRQQGGQQGRQQGGQQGSYQGSRQGGGNGGGYGGGGSYSSSSTENWINIHGAGCQRSDPKSGDASQYAGGRGPQGDAIRINNYVRLVRDL